MNTEIKQENGKCYLLVSGLELGDFYRSIGIKCSGGRVCMTHADAEAQKIAELAWHNNNNQKNPYCGA